MKMSHTFLFLLLVIFSFGQNSTEVIVRIEPYLELQNYEHFKRLVLRSNLRHVEYIQGFDFEWGYDYKLKVEVFEIVPELSDGTQFEFKLLEILSKTKVEENTEFKLFIDPLTYYYSDEEEEMNFALKPIGDTIYLYSNEVEIEVPADLENVWEKVMQSENGKLGYFTYVSSKRIRLVRF